jgi:hypothetical protein
MFGKETHIDPVGKAQNKHSKMCAIEQLNNFKKGDRQQCYSSMERVPFVTVTSLKIKPKT